MMHHDAIQRRSEIHQSFRLIRQISADKFMLNAAMGACDKAGSFAAVSRLTLSMMSLDLAVAVA